MKNIVLCTVLIKLKKQNVNKWYTCAWLCEDLLLLVLQLLLHNINILLLL